MLQKVASNVNVLQTRLKRISNQQREFADILSKKFKKLEHWSVVFEQKLDVGRKPQPSSNEPLPGPDKTVEDLDVLLKQLEIPVSLKGHVRVSVSESGDVLYFKAPVHQRTGDAVQLLRTWWSSEAAVEIAFKDHSAMCIIREVLAAGGFTNHKEIAVATRRGLRESVDWDGNSHHRGTGATEAAGIATTSNISTTTTTVSTDTVPSPSITCAAELVPSSDLIVESDSEISV